MASVLPLADKELQILKRVPAAPNASAAAAAASEFAAPEEDAGKNIIPVYCSILAAVVVGLLAYVAFKCWHTCKQKQQLAKARAGELGPAPEGEKLHSDSGVFLDTHSLQEPHQLGKGEPSLRRPVSGGGGSIQMGVGEHPCPREQRGGIGGHPRPREHLDGLRDTHAQGPPMPWGASGQG
uniref:Tumor necrosis factor receptor member 16 transmembrane domain-containing protein n=1 Tax=Apteryx owenii TaxID=8824 RepID=A0A8B9PMY6_APTOW